MAKDLEEEDLVDEEKVRLDSSMPVNDSGEEALVDRLRQAALGERLGKTAPESMKLAFDSSVDFEKRARILARFSDPPLPRAKRRTRWGGLLWIPISLSLLLSIGLALQLSGTRKTPKPPHAMTSMSKQSPEKGRSESDAGTLASESTTAPPDEGNEGEIELSPR